LSALNKLGFHLLKEFSFVTAVSGFVVIFECLNAEQLRQVRDQRAIKGIVSTGELTTSPRKQRVTCLDGFIQAGVKSRRSWMAK
jgi:hypothetical protein